MTSIESKRHASETIGRILARLDDGVTKERLEEPIDAVVRQFECEVESPVGRDFFNDTVARFVQRIHAQGIGASGLLAGPLAEAIFLLESHYESVTFGRGYVAAVLDANNPAGGGMQAVLTSLAESIKALEVQKYTRSVFLSCLPLDNWRVRCEMVGVLLGQYRAFIPKALYGCDPAQLVDNLASIMIACIHSDRALRCLSIHDETHSTAET